MYHQPQTLTYSQIKHTLHISLFHSPVNSCILVDLYPMTAHQHRISSLDTSTLLAIYPPTTGIQPIHEFLTWPIEHAHIRLPLNHIWERTTTIPMRTMTMAQGCPNNKVGPQHPPLLPHLATALHYTYHLPADYQSFHSYQQLPPTIQLKHPCSMELHTNNTSSSITIASMTTNAHSQ